MDRKEYWHQHYLANKERYKAYSKTYFQANKEKIYEQRKKHRNEPGNREIYNEKSKHYRLFGTYKLFEE